MVNYGFAINTRTCIGCHACSTACKSENEVPLGVYRTWVKYTEVGSYPDSTRSFQVTRCNHCNNPPCARICPVTAMYQRDDGIVEFDKDQCIGCKACLQACPYDAIHIDPESGTAAKCHYCSHRTDLGLEPACVVVCPEHAIIAGDLDDPHSEISKVLSAESVTVRKPEQGTAPKLFYIDGSQVDLTPTASERAPAGMMWSDPQPVEGCQSAARKPGLAIADARATGGVAPSGAALRAPQHQGLPAAGPVPHAAGSMAEHMVQVGYNVHHHVPWHWPVAAYLVTKGIAAGAVGLLAIGLLGGFLIEDAWTATAVSGIALLMTAITTGLLVYDLERPERFLRIILRPQWGSWLVKGAFILIGFSLLVTGWFGLELAAQLGYADAALAESLRHSLLYLSAIAGIGVACYTAFLFGQAEGRDLWQSTLLPVHLLLQALMAGAAAWLLLDAFGPLPEDAAALARVVLGACLIADCFVIFAGELGMPHASEVASRAAKLITAGPYAELFWGGAIVLGHVVPLVMLGAGGGPLIAGAAGLVTLIGLYCYEHAFVMAPQQIPNS